MFGGASAEIDLVDVSGAEAEEGGKVRVERLRGKGTARVSVGDDAWILKGDLDSQGQLKVHTTVPSRLQKNVCWTVPFSSFFFVRVL